jgi:hypothetical protein
MNDAQVYQAAMSTVLGQQAYLLFYSRMKPRHEVSGVTKVQDVCTTTVPHCPL